MFRIHVVLKVKSIQDLTATLEKLAAEFGSDNIPYIQVEQEPQPIPTLEAAAMRAEHPPGSIFWRSKL